MLNKRTVTVAKVVFLLPAGQSCEVERDAWLNTQVAAEMRERIGQLRQSSLHFRMNSVDVLANGLFLAYLHHKGDSTHKHAVSLTNTRVTTSVIDGGIGHLLLAQQSGKHIAERRLKQLIRCETILLAPVVHHCPVDIGRLLSHLAHRILRTCRQCGQIHACIFLLHRFLCQQVFLVAQTGILVFGSFQHAVFLWGQRFPFVCQW